MLKADLLPDNFVYHFHTSKIEPSFKIKMAESMLLAGDCGLRPPGPDQALGSSSIPGHSLKSSNRPIQLMYPPCLTPSPPAGNYPKFLTKLTCSQQELRYSRFESPAKAKGSKMNVNGYHCTMERLNRRSSIQKRGRMSKLFMSPSNSLHMCSRTRLTRSEWFHVHLNSY